MVELTQEEAVALVEYIESLDDDDTRTYGNMPGLISAMEKLATAKEHGG